MAYCVPLGIPHSRFLAWDPLDQDKALAYQRAKSELCDRCGTREATWDRDKDAYVADTIRCKGCERIEQEEDYLRTVTEEGGSTKGVRVVLISREEAEKRMNEEAGE